MSILVNSSQSPILELGNISFFLIGQCLEREIVVRVWIGSWQSVCIQIMHGELGGGIHVDILLQKATCLAENGDYEDAVIKFREALVFQPGSGALYEQLSQCQAEAGHYDQALQSAQEAARLEPQVLI